MNMKKTCVGATLALSLVLGCTAQPLALTMIESPDDWAQTEAKGAVASPETAVLGIETSPAQTEPAPSPEWYLTEGHITIVGVDPEAR